MDLKKGQKSRWQAGLLGAAAIAIGPLMVLSTPLKALAETLPLTLTTALTNGGSVQVTGVTAGRYSLTQLAARDRHRKLCLGFGDEQPDYTFTLSEPMPQLQIALDSSGQDTTLLVQGPLGVSCNDNADRSTRDAAISGEDWSEGTYRVWVGSFNSGEQLDYTLRISNP
ncbi:MAG: hypothetical protein DCF15_11725 [Phormidesmis priestleyi]|uniref:Peptidase S1 n=1 Tax=Phormidesmis priestleyi TaxID=268141 RepID=A0A2W4ZHQ5_9CYAN|nr:MAG: hypothetical protein DCF15_11725 [Phormidesmis priestleyi]